MIQSLFAFILSSLLINHLQKSNKCMEDQEAMVVIVVDTAHHHMGMAHRRLMEELGQAA